MSNIAVHAEGVGKKYRLGAQSGPYKTIRESVMSLAGAPVGVARRLTRRSDSVDAGGRRPEFWALRDVNFEVKQGEVLGIIGRNGAGKSTLLKLLSQITEPTEGRITVRGRLASLLEVGTGFHPELTGRENIFLNGAILGMARSEISRKFDEIVAFAEVEKFIDTQVKRYSSGMYLRLAFAVAAHLEPEILVIDEVLAVGDAAFQKKCLGKMSEVSAHGRTVLFVSHDMNAIAALCSTVHLLNGGRIVYSGKPGEVVKHYSDLSGRANEIHHVQTNKLMWRGIANRSQLDHLKQNEDIAVRLEFQCGTASIANLHVDCLLYNDNNKVIIHTKSKFVSDGFNIRENSIFQIDYRIISPKLVSSSYFLTVYAYSDMGVLFHADNIDACVVIPDAYFGIVDFYDELASPIIPEFTVSLIDG